jgi:hypothetical protein
MHQRVALRLRVECVRQREDDVEVRNRELRAVVTVHATHRDGRALAQGVTRSLSM